METLTSSLLHQNIFHMLIIQQLSIFFVTLLFMIDYTDMFSSIRIFDFVVYCGCKGFQSLFF